MKKKITEYFKAKGTYAEDLRSIILHSTLFES